MEKRNKFVIAAIILFILLVIYNQQKKDKNSLEDSKFFAGLDSTSCRIKFFEPIKSNSDFTYLFTTAGRQIFLLADAQTAQKVNEGLKIEKGISLNELGAGNAFFVKSEDGSLLCSANHCAVGLEKYIVKVGADIAFINFQAIPQTEKRDAIDSIAQAGLGYSMSCDFNESDSLFIKGYISQKNGEIKAVTISGVAVKREKKDFPSQSGPTKASVEKRIQTTILTMKISGNVNLAGLSGAPAFNSKGEVVGVYSGRNVIIKTYKDRIDSTSYIRVSVFEEI